MFPFVFTSQILSISVPLCRYVVESNLIELNNLGRRNQQSEIHLNWWMVDDPWTFRDGWASLVSGEIIYISPRGVPKYCRNSRRRVAPTMQSNAVPPPPPSWRIVWGQRYPSHHIPYVVENSNSRKLVATTSRARRRRRHRAVAAMAIVAA